MALTVLIALILLLYLTIDACMLPMPNNIHLNSINGVSKLLASKVGSMDNLVNGNAAWVHLAEGHLAVREHGVLCD